MIKILLSNLLQDNGWTQRDLSRKTFIREATISEMCNNRIARINVIHLSRICKALDCSVEDILRYIPDKDEF